VKRIRHLSSALLVFATLVTASVPATDSRGGNRPTLRVGFVIYAGAAPSRRTIEGQLLLAFLRAERELGIDGRVLYVNRDPTEALQSLARQRYDLVIAALVSDTDSVDRVARAFPHVRFLLPDLPIQALQHPLKNVQGTVYRAEEAGYLAGYLAALMEHRRKGKHIISAVGGYPYPGVTRWIVGYKPGARKADPHVVVRVDYSDDFANATKCERVAHSQISAGSGVVFNVAGACGLGALKAAKEQKVWGIGVDVDESFLGRHILTSPVINLDRGLFESIRDFTRGRLPTGGNTVYDLRDGNVGLGSISPDVPNAFVRQVGAIRRAIIAGRIRVPRVS